jgi:hypothetical protein
MFFHHESELNLSFTTLLCSVGRWCKRVPWMVGMRVSEVSPSVDIVVFLSAPLWHISASLKQLSLANVTTDVYMKWLDDLKWTQGSVLKWKETWRDVICTASFCGCGSVQYVHLCICSHSVVLKDDILIIFTVSSLTQDYSFLGCDTA